MNAPAHARGMMDGPSCAPPVLIFRGRREPISPDRTSPPPFIFFYFYLTHSPFHHPQPLLLMGGSFCFASHLSIPLVLACHDAQMHWSRVVMCSHEVGNAFSCLSLLAAASTKALCRPRSLCLPAGAQVRPRVSYSLESCQWQ